MHGKPHGAHTFFPVVMLVVFTIQAYFVWTTNAHEQLYYLKTFGWVNSVQRSEIIALGFNEAKFVRFLDTIIPKQAPVIIPPRNGTWFAEQSIMQFYLFPRPIWPCNEMCNEYGKDPGSFVIAMNGFPPNDIIHGKRLIEFPESGDRYIGVFVPENLVESLIPLVNEYQDIKSIPLITPFIDLVILLACLLAGWYIISLLLGRASLLDLATLGLPIALGFISWLIFISSILGFTINLPTILILFGFILFASVLGIRLFHKALPRISLSKIRSMFSSFWQETHFGTILSLIFIAWFCMSMAISIGRGYSVFDDIANWSLKGYATSYQGTIWAGEIWGGHALAYPMNLQLSIAIFKLASGDLLPGSKLLFPFFAISLLIGCFRFLNRHSVNPILSLVGILTLYSMPLFFIHSTLGMANIPFTAYLVLGILWQIEALEDDHPGKMIVAGLLYGFAGWTRPEGIGFALVFAQVVFLLSFILLKIKPSLKLLCFLQLPALLIPLTWLILMGKSGLQSDQVGNALAAFFKAGSWERNIWTPLLQIGQSNLGFLMNLMSAGLIVPLSIIILVATKVLNNKPSSKIPMVILAMAVTAALLPFGMFFVASFNETDFPSFLMQSLDRALLPAITLLWVSAILAIGQSKPKEVIIKK